MQIKIALATATTAELLEELQSRHVFRRLHAEVIVDGRTLRKAQEDHDNPEALTHYLEVRTLEFLSRGMATAAPGDRVHSFQIEQLAGDYAPGSIKASVSGLAVANVAVLT